MQRGAAPFPTGTRTDEALRAERDRFVALAFCGSDILLELDEALHVVFAAGATTALMGHTPDALVGRSFLDIIVPADRQWIGEALRSADAGQRIRNLAIRIQGTVDEALPLTLTLVGYQLPDMNNRYYLGLHLPPEADNAKHPVLATTPSGLSDGRTFAESVAERMIRLGPAADMHKMTLFRLDGLVQLEDRLEKETRTRLLNSVAGIVRSASLGGDSAGQLDSESFGLMHASSVDTKSLAERIRVVARALDPDGEGVQPRMSTLHLDPSGMNAEDAAKACLYVVDQFVAHRDGDFTVKAVSPDLSGLVDTTVHRVQKFRSLVREARFNMMFQPVVDLASRQTKHFEVLARFDEFGQPGDETYQIITFAERTGLICDFDLAMCAKVLAWLEEERAGGHSYNVAVNLSGRSIGSPAFVEALHRLLRGHPALRENLLFEITESARIQDLDAVSQVVRGLRQAGHKVCLDDFGAGASAFQYLRALEVDVVKIDGVYVRDALKTGKGQSFLKAMAGLCNDLGIATVAEMVETTNALAFLRTCGVAYGQGYLFGRPSGDIQTFLRPRPPQEVTLNPISRPPEKRIIGRSQLISGSSAPISRSDRVKS